MEGIFLGETTKPAHGKIFGYAPIKNTQAGRSFRCAFLIRVYTGGLWCSVLKFRES
jgi:hypothetical protein